MFRVQSVPEPDCSSWALPYNSMFRVQTVPEPNCCSWALLYASEGCYCVSSRFTIVMFNRCSWISCSKFQFFLSVPLLTLLRPRFRGHNQALRKKEKNWQRSREFLQQIEDAELLIEEGSGSFCRGDPDDRIPPPQPMFSPASPSPISALPPPLPPPA